MPARLRPRGASRGSDWTTLGEIADDLAISRTKARNLVLEYRARQTGAMERGERLRLLRAEVLSWPRRHVGQREDQLRVVVDDPFIRDLLKNFAYGHGILLDHSFSGEILTFDWDAYGQLLAGIYESEGGVSKEDARTMAADLRKQIVDAAAVTEVDQAILDKPLAQLEKSESAPIPSPTPTPGANSPNYENGNGYRVQCNDGMYSQSGGIQGACSGHGGVR